MKRWVTNVLLVIFCAVFLVSAYFIVDYFLDSHKQQSQFDDLSQLISSKKDPQVEEETVADATEATGPVLIQVTDPETGEIVEVLEEYAELYLLNNDIVGWMTIPGTKIDYPVMHHPESTDYYLYKDFYEKHSSHGCFYVREQCSVEPHTDNVTIYGHNMYDGTMMAALHDYKSKDFWAEHKTITFNSLTEYREYEIMAVFRIEASIDVDFQYHLFVDAADEAHFMEFVNNCKSLSLYDTGVTAQYGDKLITLSTCDRSITNGRLVVVARLINE